MRAPHDEGDKSDEVGGDERDENDTYAVSIPKSSGLLTLSDCSNRMS